MMPLQRKFDNNEIYTPSINKVDSDVLQEINDGTQHGWLASQQETDNDSDIPMISNIKHSKDGVKSKQSHDMLERHTFGSQELKYSDTNPTPFAFKRDYDSIIHRNSEGNSQRETVEKATPKSFSSYKPNYKSIIAITAAIVLQNYWRDYQKRKFRKENDSN